MDSTVFTEPAPIERVTHDAFQRPAQARNGVITRKEIQTLKTLASQQRFLASFSRYGLKAKAARAAGVDRVTVYRWEADETFAQLERLAFEDSKDAIVEAMAERGMDGVDQPVYQGGKKVGTLKRYSDAMLLALAKARMPGVFGDRAAGTGVVMNQTNNLTVVPLDRLSDEEFALLVQIHGKGGPSIIEVPRPQLAGEPETKG